MKIKGLRWWIIGLIALATVINYIDRSTLGVMWPSISKDLGMEKDDYAIILNFFMIAYAVGQSVSGRLFDKVGTRIGYVIAIGVWGLSSFMHAFARGILSFSFFRITLGLGEAGNWPGAAKSNAEWFPIKERAIAQGLFNAGASIGSVIAPPLIALLWAAFGWQVTFMIVGSFGIMWLIPWLIINKKGPKEHPWITKYEQEKIIKGQHAKENTVEGQKGKCLKDILKHRESWSVLVSRFFLEPIWWLFVGWMPIYLAEVYGFDVKQIGLFAWVPYVGAAIGSISGGYFSGKMIKNGATINRARKTAITIGGAIMFLGLLATIFLANTPLKFVVIVAFVLFGFQFTIGNIQTLPSDLFYGKSVGTLAGFGGTVGVFAVIAMNFLVPVISKISYTPIFVMIAVFVPLGIWAIYYFAKDIRPVDEKETKTISIK
ncbi:MFS transporter [Tenuifilum thalassicum]|uniref:MFS transporter n=1 Tax=Tenuifilum thalassicum TaxID=2590900 RepID=A0A7D3XDX9_9BACT|nr:MFS transporter [Tenuifilum thalassicum]QKG79467.1 MFS transporter [Tenuifilum thalassicum]